MKRKSAQATTARDIGLLIVAGFLLLSGATLLRAGHVLAETSPTEDAISSSDTVEPAEVQPIEPAEPVEPEPTESATGTAEDTASSDTTSVVTDGQGGTLEPEAEVVGDGSATGSADVIRDSTSDPADVSTDVASGASGQETEDATDGQVPDALSTGTGTQEEPAEVVGSGQKAIGGVGGVERAGQEEAIGDEHPVLSEDETAVTFPNAQDGDASGEQDDGFSVGIHMFGTHAADETPTLSPELMEDIAAFAREVGQDPNGALLSGTMGATDVRGYARGLCEQNFIKPSACVSWLIGEFADSSCRDAGLLTKGACERFLTERNGGIFPGCETLDALECDDHKALVTIDLMPDDLLDGVDRIIGEAGKEKALVALPQMTSLRPEHIGRARWWKSPRLPGQQTALGMIVIDTDLDGLPDDYEASLGTDPLVADTDKDGVDDITELQRGTNPKGPGKLGRVLRDSEKTIIFKQPLEQPAAMPDADPDMSLSVNGSSDGLQGTCDPGQTCILYFYSYVPMVLTATADEAGNWQYDLSDTMTDGHHTVYLAVTDDTGKILKRSNPLSFFVNEAKAVTFDEFVAASVEPVQAVTQGTPEQAISKYVYGVIALVLAAFLIAIGVLRKRPAVTGME